MEQLTISLDDSHAREDMLYRAKEAILSLVQYGAKILPAEPQPPSVLASSYSETLRDEKGREFRYTGQYDIESGHVKGRIDICYEPAPA